MGIEDMVNKAKDDVVGLVDKAKDDVVGLVDKAKDDVVGLVDKAKDALGGEAAVGEKVDAAAGAVKEHAPVQTHDVVDKAADAVKDL